MVIAEDFRERVHDGVRLFPNAALTFYANSDSQNGSVIRLAVLAGAH